MLKVLNTFSFVDLSHNLFASFLKDVAYASKHLEGKPSCLLKT